MHTRYFLAGVVALLLSALPASAQVRLAWKFAENDKFYQETTTSLKQTTKIRGQESHQELEHVTVTSFTVKRRNLDGSVVLEQRIEAISPSKKTDAPASITGLFQEMQGATFQITLSADMKVTKFDGYDEFVKRVGRDDPSTQKVIQTLMSKESLQNATEEAFAFLPRDPVRPGKTWERKLTASLGPLGTVTGTHLYTYEGPDTIDRRPVQRVAIEARLNYAPPRGEVGLLPFQISKGDLHVESGKGVLWFDDRAGRLVQSQMAMRIRGSLTILSMGQEYTLELDQDQLVKIRITDENPLGRDR